MTYDERRTTAYREPVTRSTVDPSLADEHRTTTVRPTAATVAGRVVVALFAIVQIAIVLRIVLLAIGAQESDALVQAVLEFSQLFVAPFEGVLRTDSLESRRAVIDLAAIVALVGWTLLEVVVLALLRIGRSGDDI
jgi:hypothetical protein